VVPVTELVVSLPPAEAVRLFAVVIALVPAPVVPTAPFAMVADSVVSLLTGCSTDVV
jgi:hypothetical protein